MFVIDAASKAVGYQIYAEMQNTLVEWQEKKSEYRKTSDTDSAYDCELKIQSYQTVLRHIKRLFKLEFEV